MAITTTLRSRRLAKLEQEKTEKLLVFPLRKLWFAVSISQVSRVFQVAEIESLPDILDVDEKLFLTSQSLRIQPTLEGSFMIVFKKNGNDLGILTSQPPRMQRVPSSAIQELSKADTVRTGVAHVSAAVQLDNNIGRCLLLDLEQI